MGWPEWIVIILLLNTFCIHAIKHGMEQPRRYYDVRMGAISVLVWLVLLQWGGFFG